MRDVVGDVEDYGGEEMYMELGGEKVEVVESERGECGRVEVLVGIVGWREYRYCEGVWWE